MALGLAARQGWWRSCSAGAIFPSGTGSALPGRLACLGSVRCGARGSHAPGAGGGQWGRGRTAELGACVALSSPGPKRPGLRLGGEGAAAAASCSSPLAFEEGWAARPGWQPTVPSLSPRPSANAGVRGACHPSCRCLKRGGSVSCPGCGRALRLFRE